MGTGIGGIIGPQLFGRLIPTGKTSDVFVALIIGSALMIIGGLVEIVFGVKAERRQLEGIAKPLTAVQQACGRPPPVPLRQVPERRRPAAGDPGRPEAGSGGLSKKPLVCWGFFDQVA